MAELRRDPVARKWMVIMTTQPKGPEDYPAFREPHREIEPIEPCPFCPGNEALTPEQILAIDPFEIWIVPRRHSPDFVSIGDEEMWALASIMASILARLRRLFQDLPYSFAIHSSPIGERYHRPQYHWHAEIIPWIGLGEGFEWATGFFVNPTPPELAATHLREPD